MSDEELIARLRSNIFGTGTTMLAADRIEALLAKIKLMDDLDAINVEKIEAIEAKLAKAVELGDKMAKSIEGNYYIPGVVKEWRATLAEIKGT